LEVVFDTIVDKLMKFHLTSQHQWIQNCTVYANLQFITQHIEQCSIWFLWHQLKCLKKIKMHTQFYAVNQACPTLLVLWATFTWRKFIAGHKCFC